MSRLGTKGQPVCYFEVNHVITDMDDAFGRKEMGTKEEEKISVGTKNHLVEIRCIRRVYHQFTRNKLSVTGLNKWCIYL